MIFDSSILSKFAMDGKFNQKSHSNKNQLYEKIPTIKQIIYNELFAKAKCYNTKSKIVKSGEYDLHLYVEISGLIKDAFPDVWDENKEFIKSEFNVNDINLILNGGPIISRRIILNSESDVRMDKTIIFYNKSMSEHMLGTKMVYCEIYATGKNDGMFCNNDTLAETSLIFTENRRPNFEIRTNLY